MNKPKRSRQSEHEQRPQTPPPELDAAVKRIFAYGPSRKRKGGGESPTRQ